MKKLLTIVCIASLAVLYSTHIASANGGPHGGFTATTDSCAGCHRTHTASGPNLLVSNSTLDLCMSCHGAAGSGANTNVDDGYYLSSRDDSAGNGNEGAANTPNNAPLLGGGFVNYLGAPVTSAHAPDESATAAWGNGVARGVTAAIAEPLNCASCHDPHGSPNYRIIQETVNGNAVAMQQVDEGDKDYDSEQWGTGASSLCQACHGAYHRNAPGQGSSLDGSTYTHRVDMAFNYGGNANPETVGFGGLTLPLAESGTSNRVVCLTCHLPHGSSAQMTGIADGGPAGDAALPGNTTATDSALLRLENRAVCQVCHQK